MNYGICSNGSRDTGYETAVKTAQILSGLGAVPVFEPGMDETCPKLKEVPGVVFADFTTIDLKAIISIGGDGTFLSKVAKYRDSARLWRACRTHGRHAQGGWRIFGCQPFLRWQI